jgi:hypothetical protein
LQDVEDQEPFKSTKVKQCLAAVESLAILCCTAACESSHPGVQHNQHLSKKAQAGCCYNAVCSLGASVMCALPHAQVVMTHAASSLLRCLNSQLSVSAFDMLSKSCRILRRAKPWLLICTSSRQTCSCSWWRRAPCRCGQA